MNKKLQFTRLVCLMDIPPTSKAKEILNACWTKDIEQSPDLISLYAQKNNDSTIVVTANRFLYIKHNQNIVEAFPIEGLPFLLNNLIEEGRH